MRTSRVRTSSRFLLASVCGVALLGASARAELRANDPYVRAALEEFERYAAQPKTASDMREKKPVTLAVVINDFFRVGAVAEKPKVASD